MQSAQSQSTLKGVACLIDPGRGDGGTFFIWSGGSRDAKDPPAPPQVVIAIEHYGRIARTLENVEGMSVEALTEGIDWSFETFPEYLDALDRTPIRLNVAGMVLLGAPYTLKMNEHVRVDLIYGMVSERTRIWIDIVCGVLFLLPICMILIYFTWPWFVQSWDLGEGSSNAGGLIRWPVKLVLPVGFALMALQGLSEIIKRVAALEHVIEAEFKYEKPVQ